MRRGYLKIFLGYASGVGKSYRMFDEARRRAERGQHVIVGGIQRRLAPDVEALLGGLEVVPMRNDGIDVDAIIARHPAVCIIDGLAYNNAAGARNAARWQDTEELLNAGIKVIGSINIQYVDELREQVERVTGKHVEETVPMAFVRSADEIEIVDTPPGQPRMARLRELALVLAAEVVDRQLVDYLEENALGGGAAAHERIMVCVTPRANVARMMAAAKIIAERFHAGVIAAYVRQPAISDDDQRVLDGKLAAASRAGAIIAMLEGEDAVAAILDFASMQRVTQLFIGHSQRAGVGARLFGNPVEKLIQNSRGMDIRIFPQ